MQNVYIIKGYRTATAKSSRGEFRFKRPDDLASETIEYLINQVPELDKTRIDDVIVGNAMPEAEQGLNIARLISLMGLAIDSVPGMTVNRYCASGLETIAIAQAKIQSGMSDCIVAGGVESMSFIPMGGYRPAPNYKIVKQGHEDYYWGMGLTAEVVAKKYDITREDQDKFSLKSHQRAINAQEKKWFKQDIAPIDVECTFLDSNQKKQTKIKTILEDQGPRADTSIEALSRLKPVFTEGGTVTAGNSSQTSDGAAFVLLMSERMIKELKLEPVSRLVSYATTGVAPRIMGIGPVKAIPKALKMAKLKQKDIDLIELNEAFASQSLAVINQLDLDSDIVNVNGGAISLGHPLGCTGAKLTVQLINEMRRRKNKYGMVTMCVGTGQGASGIFEFLS